MIYWFKHPLWKRIIAKLYIKHVGAMYIPEGKASISISRYPKVFWKKHPELEGEIKSVQISVKSKRGHQEHYFFKQFTNFNEDKNGLK